MGVYLSKANMDMESEEEKGLGMAYSVGEVQGWRRGMEDAHISILDLKSSAKKLLGAIDEKENISMFGVFDGHGGKEVAKFVQIKFIREFIKSKSFQEQQYREALRTTFHRIDDMLENPRYMDVLNKLKALPNPSDAKAAPEADSDEDKDLIGTMMGINATKKPQGSIGYIKFNPKDPQYDSDEDANQASAGAGKATSVDDIDELVNVPSQKSAEKRKVTKKQALELFTKLLQKETGTEIGGPSRGSQLKESMKNLAEAEEEEEETPQERIPLQIWKAYYEDKTRQPGDRPRPTLQAGPASVRGPSGIMCNLREHPVQAGCTSVVTLRVGNLLYCANAGDSRAVLCRKDGVAYALSEDHKPTSSIEIARIEKAGGFVNVNGRINGNLNLSRSIGDMKYKQVGTLMPSEQMITAEPDVTVTEILATDKFFVLACDGVWDVLSNQEICDFISERLFPTNKPLKFDVKNSNTKGVLQAPMGLTDIVRDIFNYCVADDPKKTQGIGGDNMTCMIVQLNI